MTANRQLALPFVHVPRLTEADFLPSAATRPALAWLARSADWPGQRLALWGGPGSGKTHLLHIWATRAGATLISGAMLRDAMLGDGWPPGPLAIDDADLAPLYSGALGFLYLSRYEGFGLPPLEAMQCGAPVVTSNTSSLPEVVGDAGVLLGPDDRDGLCQAMLELHARPDWRAELAAKSLRQARRFSWEKNVRETVEVYRQAAAEISL